MASKKIINQVTAWFHGEYRDKFPITDTTLPTWHRILNEQPDEFVKSACEQWLADSQWPPHVSEILKKCVDFQLGDIPNAHEAWSNVQNFISKYAQGSAQPQDHLSQREMQAVEHAGGFYELRHGYEPGRFHSRFCDAYDKVVKREHTEAMRLPATRALVAAQTERRERLQGHSRPRLVESTTQHVRDILIAAGIGE